MHWFPSLAPEPGLSSVRRCNSVVGFPQAVLRPSSGPRVRQGPFARRELPRFIATTAPSDSRLGRQAVMLSRITPEDSTAASARCFTADGRLQQIRKAGHPHKCNEAEGFACATADVF